MFSMSYFVFTSKKIMEFFDFRLYHLLYKIYLQQTPRR